MYRRPKFLEILLDIRREMSAEADYDVDLFAERVRSGIIPPVLTAHELAAGEAALPASAETGSNSPGTAHRSVKR